MSLQQISCGIMRYELSTILGKGSYGEVWKGKHLCTGEPVAIKKIVETNEFYGSAKNELTILKSLDHENIVTFIDASNKEDENGITWHIVLEFCDFSLWQLLQNKCHKDFHPLLTRRCILQILEGLRYLHDNGIMHRDLKPDNILFSNVFKIADFGMSKKVDDDDKNKDDFYEGSHTLGVVTLWYRAPEILSEISSYDTAIDIWSYGCIVAEFFIDHPIIMGSNPSEQMEMIVDVCGYTDDRHLVENLENIIEDVEVIQFIDEILVMEPDRRPNAIQLLGNSFFSGLEKKNSTVGEEPPRKRPCIR